MLFIIYLYLSSLSHLLSLNIITIQQREDRGGYLLLSHSQSLIETDLTDGMLS